MMSFTETVKNEICAGLPKKTCCRRALLFGMMIMRGHVVDDRVSLYLDGEAVFFVAEKMIFEQFGREAIRQKRKDAVNAWMLNFSSANAASRIKNAADLDPRNPVEEKCSACRRSFLSGIFLAAGRVCDPGKQYLLEFSCGEKREFLADFLSLFSLTPKWADRRKERILYFRDSTSIEDLFTHIGITHATFAVMDKKIEHGMRNDANRIANCDANNIEKSIAASMKQVELIKRLIGENKISFLPPELEKTARLRLQYDGMTVAQLAAMADPPLTKSGLHHRLQKITDMAEILLNDKKGGA